MPFGIKKLTQMHRSSSVPSSSSGERDSSVGIIGSKLASAKKKIKALKGREDSPYQHETRHRPHRSASEDDERALYHQRQQEMQQFHLLQLHLQRQQQQQQLMQSDQQQSSSSGRSGNRTVQFNIGRIVRAGSGSSAGGGEAALMTSSKSMEGMSDLRRFSLEIPVQKGNQSLVPSSSTETAVYVTASGNERAGERLYNMGHGTLPIRWAKNSVRSASIDIPNQSASSSSSFDTTRSIMIEGGSVSASGVNQENCQSSSKAMTLQPIYVDNYGIARRGNSMTLMRQTSLPVQMQTSNSSSRMSHQQSRQAILMLTRQPSMLQRTDEDEDDVRSPLSSESMKQIQQESTEQQSPRNQSQQQRSHLRMNLRSHSCHPPGIRRQESIGGAHPGNDGKFVIFNSLFAFYAIVFLSMFASEIIDLSLFTADVFHVASSAFLVSFLLKMHNSLK